MREEKEKDGYVDVRALQQKKGEGATARPGAEVEGEPAKEAEAAATNHSHIHPAEKQAEVVLQTAGQRTNIAEDAEANDVARRRAEKELRAVKEELADVKVKEAEEEEAREELEEQLGQANATRQELKKAFAKERAAREAAEDELSDKKKNYWITPKFPTAPPPPKIHWKPPPVPRPLIHPVRPRLDAPQLRKPLQHPPPKPTTAKPTPPPVGKLVQQESDPKLAAQQSQTAKEADVEINA
jgi:hypothetical protein